MLQLLTYYTLSNLEKYVHLFKDSEAEGSPLITPQRDACAFQMTRFQMACYSRMTTSYEVHYLKSVLAC